MKVLKWLVGLTLALLLSGCAAALLGGGAAGGYYFGNHYEVQPKSPSS